MRPLTQRFDLPKYEPGALDHMNECTARRHQYQIQRNVETFQLVQVLEMLEYSTRYYY